jgi:hypothetical protein
MLMGLESVFILCVLLDKTAKFVGIVDRSWSLDSSNGVVIQKAEFEGQSGNHHFNILDLEALVLGQIVFYDEVVRWRCESFGGLLRNEVKLVVFVANVFP